MLRFSLVVFIAALAAAVPACAASPNSWRAGPYFGERELAASATLNDGRLLVAGGQAGQGRTSAVVTPVAEVFDSRLGRWQATGNIPGAIPPSIILTPLLDGGALAVYARYVANPLSFVTATARFDPPTNSWRSTTPPPSDGQQYEARGGPITLKDGRILLLRARTESSAGSTLLYDPTSDAWAGVASPTEATGPLVALADGRVLAVGRSPAAFDPATTTWTPVAPRGFPSMVRYAVRLPSQRVLVAGEGWADEFDPRTGDWRTLFRDASFLPAGLAVLHDGRVLAPRGPGAWIVDPQLGRLFTAAAPRREHAYGVVATLPDGRVLLGGGMECSHEVENLDGCGSSPVVELYEPPPTGPVVSSASVRGRGRLRKAAFTLNEAADVRMVLARRVRGRWRAVRYGHRQPVRAGPNLVGLAGRLDLRRVPAGAYRLSLFTRDLFDRTGGERRLTFRLR